MKNTYIAIAVATIIAAAFLTMRNKSPKMAPLNSQPGNYQNSQTSNSMSPTDNVKVETSSDIDAELNNLDKSMDSAQKLDSDSDPTVGL